MCSTLMHRMAASGRPDVFTGSPIPVGIGEVDALRRAHIGETFVLRAKRRCFSDAMEKYRSATRSGAVRAAQIRSHAGRYRCRFENVSILSSKNAAIADQIAS